jgi:hypothetical protein
MKPPRNRTYLRWIRTLTCAVCGETRGIEASHTGPHGIGQKSSDYSAIPLCDKHHRTASDSYHKLGPRKFAQRHGLDVTALVRLLNRKPLIRIEAGRFVGYLDDQLFSLGGVDAGVAPAVRKMTQLAREDRIAQLSRKIPA